MGSSPRKRLGFDGPMVSIECMRSCGEELSKTLAFFRMALVAFSETDSGGARN